MKVTCKCEYCGQSFERWPHEVKARTWCSRVCYLRDKDSKAGKTYRKYQGRHEHRVIAEQLLGRALLSGEIVHHRDGDKRNNSPENLEVLPSQAAHAREHLLGSSNPRSRKVICLDTGTSYPTIQKAAEATQVNARAISMVCRGVRHHAGGLRWAYQGEVMP